MTTIPLSALDAHGYAAAVRAALDDLDPEIADDLAEGLEADLAEQAAEREIDDLSAAFGSPAAYADELRLSAGLDPRAPQRSTVRRRLDRGQSVARERWNALQEWIERHPWVQRFWAGMVSLRPTWWLARVLIPAVLLLKRDLFSFPNFVMALAAVVLSVAVGRGWLSRFRVVGVVAVLANLVAVAMLPGFIAHYQDMSRPVVWNLPDDAGYNRYTYGVTNQGGEVANIFAYDRNGKPIEGVQLFDDRGQPLLTNNPSFPLQDGYRTLFPYRNAQGGAVWNVYPLWASDQVSGSTAIASPSPQPLPKPSILPVQAPAPSPTVGPSPAATQNAQPKPTSTATP